jgi:hypothetical protein
VRIGSTLPGTSARFARSCIATKLGMAMAARTPTTGMMPTSMTIAITPALVDAARPPEPMVAPPGVGVTVTT